MVSALGSRPLTRPRIAIALAAALVADVVPLALGPLGWTFADEIVDVAMMIVASATLGFHWLFLPTFVLELVPLVDALPTWTASVIAVIGLRRRVT
jgi:hypothetical protein